MKTQTLLGLTALALATTTHAGTFQWKQVAESISGNVVADDAGDSYAGPGGAPGTGYEFSGTGIEYNYGNLNEDGNTASVGAGAAIEYAFNASDIGVSIALGKYEGWQGENTVLKLEQYFNTKVFGITIPGAGDWSFNSAPSVFDEDTHALFNFRTDGQVELFVNGISQGLATRGAWIVNGDLPGDTNRLGSGNSLTTDAMNGSIYAVGTYERQLTTQEISDLSRAFLTPEPTSAVVGAIGLAGLAARRRRRG